MGDLVTALAPTLYFDQFQGRQHGLAPLNRAVYVLSFDCDYEKDIKRLPYLLDVLAEHNIKASIACIGMWVERFPEIHRRMVSEGHEILNHTYSHPDNEELNPGRYLNRMSFAE